MDKSELPDAVEDLQEHAKHDLDHTQNEREREHLLVVEIDLLFHIPEKGNIQVVNVESEKSAGKQTAHSGGSTQDLHKPEHTAHGLSQLLFHKDRCQRCSNKQKDTIAYVSECQPEEDHKERCEIGRQVYLIVFG